MLYWNGESICEGDCESGDGVGNDEIYNGKAEPVLVSVLDSYSEDNSILVCDSRLSLSPAYTTTDYLRLLTTALKEM